MSDLIVKVTEGKVLGRIRKTANNYNFYSFKGIPYAKPPVEELRFAPPVPPEPWNEIKDCTKDCNICAQFDKEKNQVIGDEDCLYLNVYTPNLPDNDIELLPVMVFFHGGGFVFGHGTDDSAHGPDFLIEKNVVVVSLNYRLGILGFLSLGFKEAAGNMGLKDQVQALKWVQKNIKVFNGDPTNVTLFGFSAGAASVEYLLLSPTAKGLFHKAIAHSGSSLLPWAQNNKIKELARKIPKLKNKTIDDDTQLVDYLKKLPIKDLVCMSMLVLAASQHKGGINFGFVPTVEDSGDWEPFISKSTYKSLSQGEFNKVPFIAGCCTREGLLMVSHGAATLEKLTNDKDFLSYLPFTFDDTQKKDLEVKLKSTYLEGQKLYDEPDDFAINYFSDLDFIGGVYVSTLLIGKHNSPTFFYEFSYDSNMNYLKKKYNINRKGACHGDDGGYLIRSDILKDYSDMDILVKNRICQMWTDFAKSGNPTPVVDGKIITTKWEPITESSVPCLVIDDKLTIKYDFYNARMKLCKELYENYYKY